MARLYVNANVRKLSGITFVEFTAMIASILRQIDRRENVRSIVCDK